MKENFSDKLVYELFRNDLSCRLCNKNGWKCPYPQDMTEEEFRAQDPDSMVCKNFLKKNILAALRAELMGEKENEIKTVTR